MESEEMLLETLKDWQFLLNRLSRLKDNIKEKEYRITPTLSDAKVFVIGANSSKVETFCFSRMKITDEIDEINRKMKLCCKAYKQADLTKDEKIVIRYTVKGLSLRQLSKSKNIAQAKIYRIRDKAVKKMFSAIQNERKD